MTRFHKQVLSQVLIAGLLASAAFAGSKEDPHETLTKSFQQGNIWQQGPVKMVAKVRMAGRNGQPDVNLEYTVSWAGPEKWRAEWTANGLSEITVLNNGKLSYFSSQPNPVVLAIQFEEALAALDAGTPAGPYSMPPLDYQKQKLDVTKKKIGAVDAKCMAFGSAPEIQTYCVDPSNYHMLSAEDDAGTFEYSDYAQTGPANYPQTVKVSYAKTLTQDAKVTVTRGDKFEDALFTAPEKSTTVDFHTCADVDKNFTAPHVSKSVPAKMPEAARKAKKYGVVWTLATVGTDGAVQKVDVIGGDPDLTTSTKDAVQQYKFTPYLRCGQPVPFRMVIVVPYMPMAIPDLGNAEGVR